MTKKPKRPSAGEKIAMAAYGGRYERRSPGVQSIARRIDAAIRRAVGKRDSYWVAALAKWSHVQPTIESHRMIVKTMSQQERSTP